MKIIVEFEADATENEKARFDTFGNMFKKYVKSLCDMESLDNYDVKVKKIKFVETKVK
jgi:hypothetical protein